MTARRAFFIVGLIAAAAATPLAAEATDGRTLLLFVTPQDAGVSETLSIDIETYWAGQPVDVDDLRLTMSPYGASPSFSNVSLGKYHATYKLLQGDVDGGTITMQASALIGQRRAGDTAYYLPRGGHPSGGWGVQLRQVSPQNLAPPPGSHVVLEARSYDGYALQEGGAINATLTFGDGASLSVPEVLPPTRIADGVYRFDFDIPLNLSVSRQYDVTARLGVANYGSSDYLHLWSNPVPVTAYVTGGNGSAVVLRVIAGTRSPVAGAQVELREVVHDYPYPAPPGAVFRNSTDGNGMANLVVKPSDGNNLYVNYNLNVSKGNRTTTLPIALSFTTLSAWHPEPPYNYSCEVRLQSDLSRFGPGDTAELAFRVTYDGQAEVRHAVPRFVWRTGVAGTVFAGNVTTDANGTFAVNYPVPTNWTSGDSLTVQVECPEGEAGRTSVQFGGIGIQYGGRGMVVEAHGALGRNLTLNATYTGSRPLTGTTALALLIPGKTMTGLVTQSPPDAIYVPLELHGRTFSGSVAVPAWMPEGDYLVVVEVSNKAATADASEQVMEIALGSLTLFPPPPDPRPPPPPSGSTPAYASAQASLVSFTLGSISMAIGAAWFVSMRRRRFADARAERGVRLPSERH